MATNTVDPLTPNNVLQDPMMSALSLTIIAYITDMVTRQIQQQERENGTTRRSPNLTRLGRNGVAAS